MLNGNPNQRKNPYAPTGVNNPQSYGQQRTAGQLAPQPNRAGYGGGTNTSNYGRIPTQQPAPLAPGPLLGAPAPTPWQAPPTMADLFHEPKPWLGAPQPNNSGFQFPNFGQQQMPQMGPWGGGGGMNLMDMFRKMGY